MWSMATPRRSGASLATGQSGICELSDARSLSGSSGYVPKLASILSNSTKMRSTSVSTARLSSPGVLVSTATPQSFERMGECMLNPAQPSSCYDCSNHASAGRHLPGRAVRGPRLLTVFHSADNAVIFNEDRNRWRGPRSDGGLVGEVTMPGHRHFAD